MSKIKSSAVKLLEWVLKKRKNQKNITVFVFSQLYIFFLTFCITYFIFKLLTNLETSTLGLIFGEKTDLMFPRFLVSYLFVLIICEFLYFTTFFLYIPLAIYPAAALLGIANVAKINFRGDPIVFTDMLLFRETVNIASQYPLGAGKYLPFLIPVLILLLVLPLFLRRLKVKAPKRIISVIAAFAVSFLFFARMFTAEKTVIEKTAGSTVWNLAQEYGQNGFILEFMLSAKRSFMLPPNGYGKEAVKNSALELGYPENYDTADAPDILPNVIVIMNEAYWNTDNLTGIGFNADPLESVRKIMDQSGNLSMLSPHVGGGTANIEFEFLTGKNIVYYPPAAMVYQQFITQKHWSLAWYFRSYGYSATAIHPYFDWFWKRNSVYPLLGFENIYFNDGNLKHKDIKGRYISDKAVADEIIYNYEKFSENGGKPVFTFAVTMQNHGPYYAWYSGGDAVIKSLNELGEKSANIVETYAEGVRYASEAFLYITQYFENEKRPTYIVMFGDHAPSPVADMAEYYAIGENGEITEEVIYNKYTTPLLVWTNVKDPETEEKIRNIKTVTPQMLTGEIFNITGMPKPPYIEMLENIKKTTRGFNSRYILDENGIHRPAEDFETLGDIYEKLKLVQYDATLGKKYFADEFAKK